MSKLTDKEIIIALKKGEIIMLNDAVKIRELLNGEKGTLYAKNKEKDFWMPFHPDVYDLETDSWKIDRG